MIPEREENQAAVALLILKRGEFICRHCLIRAKVNRWKEGVAV